MLRNTGYRFFIFFLFFLVRVTETLIETCVRQQIGLRNCSAEDCYRCTISTMDEYARIPPNVTGLSLFFSSEAGDVLSSRLPLLPQLREMDLSLSEAGDMPTIPNDYFSGCPLLDALTIYHGRTSSVVVRLLNGSFAGLSSLTRLTVSGLGLRELPVGVFSDLRRLKILHLNLNNLTKIARGTFANQRQLNTLFLGRNKFTSLLNVSFQGLDSLRVIDLYQNQIRILGSDMGFLALKNLTQINLAENGMRQIDSYAFTGLQRLEKLYLEKNSLRELTVNVFNDLVHLRELDLSGNRLRMLPSNLFTYLRSLENLCLRANELEEIASDAFEGLKKLRNLDLSFNLIRSIEEKGLEGLTSLKNLHLNDNKINRLSFSELLSLHSLERLDLRNNSLETMTIGALDTNELSKDLSYLDLSQNPWNCNCNIFRLILWLQSKNLTRILQNSDLTKCNLPEALRNTSLLSALANHTCSYSLSPATSSSPSPTHPPDEIVAFEAGLSRNAEMGIIIGSVLFALVLIIVVSVIVYARMKRFGLWDRQRSESIDKLHRAKRNKYMNTSSAQQELSLRSETTINRSCDNSFVAPDGSKGQSRQSGRDRVSGRSTIGDDPECSALTDDWSLNNLCHSGNNSQSV